MNRDQLKERLERYAQGHLLRFWNELSPHEQSALTRQIEAVDFDWLSRQQARADGPGGDAAAELARRATPPVDLVSLPTSEADAALHREARNAGEALIGQGRVGAILVAGGEATRLGFPHPKGMFPIGPVSGRMLFQLLAGQLLARSRRAGRPIPYYVMTSSATHDETVACFREHAYFGLDPADVKFFRQGNLPAVDRVTGRLLQSARHELALNPDGHGGLLAALEGAGLLDDMRRRGVEYLYYHQVDNPLAQVCDPVFLGLHVLRQSEMTTKVVAKLSAEEKMGVVCSIDGRTQVIEYSDLPKSAACETDEQGRLRLGLGNTAIHVFSRSFLERLVQGGIALPVHHAIKKVPALDDAGRLVEPETENAIKYERFIFDALPVATRALVVEGARDDEFCPLKNKEGEFSPAYVQRGISRLHARWLRAAGIDVPDGLSVEISPLYALDADELVARIDRQMKVGDRIFLE